MFQNQEVRDGDSFFFGDVEFWGVEALRLMAAMNNIQIKMFGFLHAASYTKEDAFSIASDYQKYTEVGWFRVFDKIFVGSSYHKEAVMGRRVYPIAHKFPEDVSVIRNSLVVVPNPLFIDDFPKFDVQKKMQIILPNRYDSEKRPNITLNIALNIQEEMSKEGIDVKIIVTTSSPKLRSNDPTLLEELESELESGRVELLEGLSKQEYYLMLAESSLMISASIEENFGYCIQESLYYNTPTLLTRGLSHTEMVHGDDEMLFELEDSEAVEKGINLIKKLGANTRDLVTSHQYSIKEMVLNMREGEDEA